MRTRTVPRGVSSASRRDQVTYALAAVALFFAFVGTPLPAAAQSTAANGKIAYGSNDYDIYVMDADGSNPVNLTNSPNKSESGPVWSPDGSKIAFVQSHYYPETEYTYSDIWVMDVDGSNRVNLTNTSGNDEFSPTWSPRGDRIAFVKSEEHPQISEDWGIFVMDADGGNVTSLTNAKQSIPYEESTPAWSPDGSAIAYAGVSEGKRRIMVMDPDGENQRMLSTSDEYDHDTTPTWSPDSGKIAFMREIVSEGYQWDIMVMNRDGSGEVRLTRHPDADMFPTFSPDGTQIAFLSNRDTWMMDIYLIDVPVLASPSPTAQLAAAETSTETTAARRRVTRLRTAGAVGRLDWRRPPATAFVVVTDSGLEKPKVTVGQGESVRWTFKGASSHTVTDSSGMDRFDSGVSAPGSARFFVLFPAAGIYPYKCELHPNMTGIVKVPIKVAPSSGVPNSAFTIEWSSVPAPSGYVYDVQIKRPGTKEFVDWRLSRTARKTTFTADAGVGDYFFRARMRRLTNAAHARYSPARGITVAQP